MKTFVQSRWSPWLAIVATLALLAGAIALTQSELRSQLRSQLARRDGNLFASLLRRQLHPEDGEVVDPLAALLETSRLPDMPGLQSLSLFDTEGRFSAALPVTAPEAALSPAALAAARTGGMFSQLDLNADLSLATILPTVGRGPLLEVVVPIEDPLGGNRSGFARLLLDGSAMAAEYAALDAALWRQSLLAFVLAGAAMATALALAFRRIHAINRRLQAANTELTLAARTAAIGAVTSHLLHGLKNPLAGLQQFVSGQAGREDPDWTDAAETTRRMRGMIDHVMQVLRTDSFAHQFDLPLSEVLTPLVHRVDSLARPRSVVVRVTTEADALLTGRDASLVALVVENLVTNAVQASPIGREVFVRSLKGEAGLEIRVSDLGSGLPDHVRDRLFSPVQSTKIGGSGIGLAISRQIALSVGASLELVRTGSSGTEFCLRLPAPVAAPTASGK